ncbi:TPA: hypothetical protein DEW47_03745 [Patescibacteria group bacterium]|nr:MAG: hypothetical protein UT97_C0015G0019 [Parcubacteria group bacterium GW2011_GWC2_40_31]KKR74447.1 MAG: hypothetical protein UU18_C0028G0015 [Parcubacteria group bacterium GW2011_GWB2_40_8]KKR75909.1 MAG: hypothetical protein UU20_C0039G0004 [Parcubacteria group bacterium GW2011_GWE2_40_8]KKR82209.1 MAG: hypothetical protein UU28_C0013G0020 [Parcubacteria group bacterium GW2011_GWD2_40_9]HBB56808.1 hypothetical protein [Patescibacteria group bacterium]
MTKSNIIIGIIGAVVVIGFALGVPCFIKSLKNAQDDFSPPEETGEEVIAIIDKIDIPSDIADHILSKSDLVKVYSPRPFSVIASPLTVWGEARGAWFFEANFQLTLVDWDGRIIAESFASALLNPNDPDATWMTEEFVPFEGTIEFENPSNEADFSKRGALIFQKANPSGLAERADALEIPILFK